MNRSTTPHDAVDNGLGRYGVAMSIALHLIVTAIILIASSRFLTTEIVAAGPGEGGEGGGSIDVGVADPSAILGFAKPQPISNLGDRDDKINNARIEHAPREEETRDDVPATEKQPNDPKSVKTDRPVANQTERNFTGKDERGKTDSTSAQVGRTYGTPTPALIGGVGIGSGGAGGGTGLPGGSEYGRRIQMIFSRNYNPPQTDAGGVELVVIALRISRDGRILSVVNGRVDPASIRQRAQIAQVNYAAERAIIASNPLPPFPPGFLPSVGEVSVNLIFRYPK